MRCVGVLMVFILSYWVETSGYWCAPYFSQSSLMQTLSNCQEQVIFSFRSPKHLLCLVTFTHVLTVDPLEILKAMSLMSKRFPLVGQSWHKKCIKMIVAFSWWQTVWLIICHIFYPNNRDTKKMNGHAKWSCSWIFWSSQLPQLHTVSHLLFVFSRLIPK